MDSQAFRRLDLSALGLTPGEDSSGYFCTPEGAEVLGWTGVDGIHFCTVQGFGDMVFAVSPANLPGEYVHLVARNLEDFLGLLRACGADAVEQAHGWDRQTFDAFLAENSPGAEAKAAAERLKEQGTEIPDPYGYLHELQANFDYETIPWKREYLEMLGEEPEETKEEQPWVVTFRGSLWGHAPEEEPGQEIPVNRTFSWDGDTWLVPAVYRCDQGLVVDLCLRVEEGDFLAFAERWSLWEDPEGQRLTMEQREQLETEHPLSRDVLVQAEVNGRLLRQKHGCGVGWLSCLRNGVENCPEARQVLDHYGLDPRACWSIQRLSFPWAGETPPVLRTLTLRLSAREITLPGPHFRDPAPGVEIVFDHPITKISHTLTVREREDQVLSAEMFPDDGMDRPRCYQVLSYTVTPDLKEPGFFLRDCCEGDPVRPKSGYGPTAHNGVAMAVIGGADGPVVVLTGGQRQELHTACSSLYYAPPETVEWRLGFRKKPREDRAVALLPVVEQPADQMI